MKIQGSHLQVTYAKNRSLSDLCISISYRIKIISAKLTHFSHIRIDAERSKRRDECENLMVKRFELNNKCCCEVKKCKVNYKREIF
jgi:hypothetical protein